MSIVCGPAAFDYLSELFGGEAASQAPAAVSAAAPEPDPANLREAIRAARNDAQRTRDDWASRKYRANGRQIDLHGDGPSRRGSISVSTANEARRRRMVEMMNERMAALGRLERMPAGELDALLARTRADAERQADLSRRGGNQDPAYTDPARVFDSFLRDALNLDADMPVDVMGQLSDRAGLARANGA